MRSLPTAFTTAIARQTIFGVLVLVLSLPLVRGLHARFGLGEPPTSALVIIGISVLVCFIGAGVIGVLAGQSARGRGPAIPIALGGALLWSILVCGIVVPYYGTSVVENLATGTAMDVVRDRSEVLNRARGAYDDVRGGKTSELAQRTAGEAIEKSKGLARAGAARLPALILLIGAIVLSPIGAAFEARRARR